MIAKIKMQADPWSKEQEIVEFLTLNKFKKDLERTIHLKDNKIVGSRDQEAVWWSRNGRLGSHWQIGNIMYVKVKDKNDDPFKYYKPEKLKISEGNTNWGKSSCCDGGKNCSSCKDCK